MATIPVNPILKHPTNLLVNSGQIDATKKRLDFDPSEKRKDLRFKKPVENESGERVAARFMTAAMEGMGSLQLERIIKGNDLMSVNYLQRGTNSARSVARVIVRGGAGQLRGYGTGFMISPHLLMTNNHVLESEETAQNSQAHFNYQFDVTGQPMEDHKFALKPEDFFYTHKELDFTVVAVADAADTKTSLSDFGYLTLNRTPGKALLGEYLTILQHPNGEYKDVALRENQLLRIENDFLWYQTDTAPGASGSPVFNDTWQVIALHHSGVPDTDPQTGQWKTVDGQIWDSSMGEDKIKWIANEGVRISRIIDTLRQDRGDAHLIVEFVQTTVGSADELAPHGDVQPQPVLVTHRPQKLQLAYVPTGSTSHPPLSATAQVDIPINLHLSVSSYKGAAGDVSQAHVHTPPQIEISSLEKVQPDPNYASRKGYDPEFLGSGARSVPLPTLTPEMLKKVALNQQANNAEAHVLPYHHFSVVVNRERKLSYVTAVNIDGSVQYRVKRDRDQWFPDPRIEKNAQAGPELYKKNDLDFGHLVRRLDPAWGRSEALAIQANDDTFHLTNCSPQHKDFNRNQATWAGLEDYILDHADNEQIKVTVFTAPVLTNNDPFYREIQIPVQFFKVVVMPRQNGRLSATAYLLSQAMLIHDLRDEEFRFGPYKTFQVPIRKIERLTGLGFGNLRQCDPLNDVEHFEAIGVREIANLSEIRL